MPHPLTVVFDLDGTLVDTAPDLTATMNEVLAELGRPPLAVDSVRLMVGRGARLLISRGLAASGDPVGEAELDRLVERFLIRYETRIAEASRPFPGLEDALNALSGQGAVAAVCTNKPERLSLLLLEALGLASRFSAVVGGDSLDVRKPDPRHLVATIERAGGIAAQAVMVGDSATDRDAARAAGVPFVGVSFGYTETPMAELGPDILIDEFSELPAAVARLTG